MGTRATYRFTDKSDRFAPSTTIYIHWDGYETGAATYFYAALTKPSKGCFCTQFIRANEQAELTKSHDAHGDTEYRYDIDGEGPTARLECRHISYGKGGVDDRQFALVFIGTVAEFVSKHRSLIEDFSEFMPVTLPYGRTVMLNKLTAANRLNTEYGPLSHLRIWDKSPSAGNRESANWKSCADEARTIIAAFPELATEESDALLAVTSAAN